MRVSDDTIEMLAEAAVRVIAPPPRPRPLLEFVAQLRYPDGPFAGERCDPISHPAAFELWRDFAAGGYDELVALGPVQDGKTWATIVVPMLYMLAELRLSVVYGLPDRALAGKAWRAKLKPTIEGCGLAHLLPTSGPGSDGGAPDDVLMTTGARLYMLGAGARNEAGQAMVSGAGVFIDERDSIRSRWVELLKARSVAWDVNARNHSTSTLKDDHHSTTWAVYLGSSRCRLVFRCHHCVAAATAHGGWQTFDWERVDADWTNDDTARDTIRIVCAHDAAHRITEDERRAALRSWKRVSHGQAVTLVDNVWTVTGTPPATRRRGLRWSALDSPLKSLGRLAVQYRQGIERRDAYGDHEPLRQFYRDLLALPYKGDLEANETLQLFGADYDRTREYLGARSSVHGWAPMVDSKAELYSRHVAPPPDQASLATFTIDVQQNRLYWLAIAADREARTWDMAHGYEYGREDQAPMTEAELHAALDRLRDEVLPDVCGDLLLAGRGVDTKYHTDWLIRWLASNREWMPVQGLGDELAGKKRDERDHKNLPGVVYLTKPEGWRLGSTQPLHLVDVERVKEQAQTAFLRPPNAAGAAHLPLGMKLGHTYIMHLCGELLQEDPKTGRRKWRKTIGRHDYLDCRTYGVALLRLHIEKARRMSLLEDDRDDQAAAPPAPSTGGGDWVGGGSW